LAGSEAQTNLIPLTASVEDSKKLGVTSTNINLSLTALSTVIVGSLSFKYLAIAILLNRWSRFADRSAKQSFKRRWICKKHQLLPKKFWGFQFGKYESATTTPKNEILKS
jgi:hypothetical protein